MLYTKGCDLVDAHWPESEIIDYPLTDDEQAEIDKAVENARQADVAVVVLGGGQRTCGENKSRTSLDLPGRQLQLLQAIQATGKPVVLILINGRPTGQTSSSPLSSKPGIPAPKAEQPWPTSSSATTTPVES